jgi:hypothetical protein
MDLAIIRPSQSLVKGGGSPAQFRLSDGVSRSFPSSIAIWEANALGDPPELIDRSIPGRRHLASVEITRL